MKQFYISRNYIFNQLKKNNISLDNINDKHKLNEIYYKNIYFIHNAIKYEINIFNSFIIDLKKNIYKI